MAHLFQVNKKDKKTKPLKSQQSSAFLRTNLTPQLQNFAKISTQSLIKVTKIINLLS